MAGSHANASVNYASAHFSPSVRPIDEFNPAELEGGITSARIERPKELDWLDSYGNIVLAGPSGLGKTMIALGLGLLAVVEGYTPITKQQASRFFSFVPDAYERTSMIFTTNKEMTQWEELMGDQALATAMLDRILHHARCFSLRGESCRLKHPELYAADQEKLLTALGKDFLPSIARCP